MLNSPSNADAPTDGPGSEPLREDVRRLGARLGELLREIAPAGVFESVEAARLSARRRRAGEQEAPNELATILGPLSPAHTLDVVRAFSAYFGLVNTAEQTHRMRRRVEYARKGEAQPESLCAALLEIARRGTSAKDVRVALQRVLVEPVFTAHPTEAVRRTLLKKDQRLARALVARFPVDIDPITLARLDALEGLEIASAWQTEEQLPGPPSVADEVEHVLFFLSDVLYPVVPALHEELERAFQNAFGEALAVQRPLVRFSSWVGGDMDGNPNVGAETIRATLARHLELALRCYRQELLGLHEHLSQSASRVHVDDEVWQRIAHYVELLAEEAQIVPARYEGMPYRRLLWLMSARLDRKGRGISGGYGAPQELRDDLELIANSLHSNAGSRAGLDLVRRALWRVDVFGFHLASLDVRQDAEVHRSVIGTLLNEPEFAQLPSAARTERIAQAIPMSSTIGNGAQDPETRHTLEVFRALSEMRADYGVRSLGCFVISMAQGPDDALAVLLLARAGGCLNDDGNVPLDVTPLFETIDDLSAAPDVLRTLLTDPTYSAHLQARGGRQMVMLGYSDSSKDGGIASSRIAIDRAQERLVQAAAEFNVVLTLFHGRGGSISRGGSKPRAGILAAPPGALGGHVRCTEQGEIIGDKFGLRGIATRTLEVSLGALLERTAGGDPAQSATAEDHQLTDILSEVSRTHYRRLVHDEPDFPTLFQGMTPIDVIERLDIGSRPARRRQMRGVGDLRAIPWVFAWAQCRATMTGWFGMGAGLQAAIDSHGLNAVRRSARDWPFFATLLSDVEMALAMSDIDIAARYAELAGSVGARLFPSIREEFERSVATLLEIKQSNELLENDPMLQRSIRLRNPYVDPLSFVQVELLSQWREGNREDKELERILIQTVRGIARGLRTTG